MAVLQAVLNLSRDSLKVPAIRSVLEYLKYGTTHLVVHTTFSYSTPTPSFLILFFLFIITIEISERDQLTTAEIIFIVYALGFTLEKVAAMQEHGIKGFLSALRSNQRI